jgi:murein DD-endopeptidase MepM/ murein hydrolase activator NlpD
MVELEHPGGLHTAYCHLSKFAPGLHGGPHVEARQLIGYVGQTGRATGPHLHFAVKRGTMFVDPLSLKMDGVRVLPPVDREVFAKLRTDLDGKLDGVTLPASPDVKDDAKDKDEDDPNGEVEE